jgi:putative chitinase
LLATTELKAIMPAARDRDIALLLDPINQTLERFSIDTRPRLAAFVANFAHETGQLRYMAEIWGPTPAQKRYEPPGSLATKLGNKYAGDGSTFRGRGLLMLTGRHNYWEASESLEEPAILTSPEIVADDPYWAATTAGWYWWRHNLNALADKEDFERACDTCRAVNGGNNGLSDRQQFYERAYEVL